MRTEIYHKGNLAFDRGPTRKVYEDGTTEQFMTDENKAVDARATAMWNAYVLGKCQLVQKRVSGDTYYMAQWKE